jgi:hypothetical protein
MPANDPLHSPYQLYCTALIAAYPGAEFTISDPGYETLLWHDTTIPKPTEAEFDAAVAAQLKVQAQQAK